MLSREKHIHTMLEYAQEFIVTANPMHGYPPYLY